MLVCVVKVCVYLQFVCFGERLGGVQGASGERPGLPRRYPRLVEAPGGDPETKEGPPGCGSVTGKYTREGVFGAEI